LRLSVTEWDGNVVANVEVLFPQMCSLEKLEQSERHVSSAGGFQSPDHDLNTTAS